VYIKKILITYDYTAYVIRGCTNSGHQDAPVTKFCLVEPNFESSVCYLLYVILMACRILKWLVVFCKNCVPLTE
jgi:hypothetical protein